jgi:hypothetical protein
MRPLFQHGIGPHRFSKILRILHKERYDELQLQYYSTVHEKANSTAGRFYFPGGAKDIVRFSSFGDPDQYGGYVPSASYVSHVYSSIIEQLRPFMDQHTSMLDGVVLKGDHSFKVIKHMGKINGISTFLALYTVLNEYEEIRLQVIAHTKALSHLAPSFNSMIDTYKKLNFEMPKLFYTDNVAGDKQFLEKVIPSLLDNVEHVHPPMRYLVTLNDLTSLSVASLPENIQVSISSDSVDIDSSCAVIL